MCARCSSTTTEKFQKELAREKQIELTKADHDKHHQAVRDGYIRQQEIEAILG